MTAGPWCDILGMIVLRTVQRAYALEAFLPEPFRSVGRSRDAPSYWWPVTDGGAE